MNVAVQPSHAPGGDGRSVSITVPTYREAENLTPLVGRIAEAMSPLGRPYEIILVDDNSGDGTEEVVAKLAAEGHAVRVIVRKNERGLSSAVIRGFREATGDILVCMDADLSHPPEAIPRLLECLEDPETDFAIGSRYVPGASTEETWGVFRWLNSKVATLLARPFVKVKDPMSGFFALRRGLFNRSAPLSPVGYKIGLELMVKCGCKGVREVPIHFADRKFGQSKLSLKEQINYIKHLKRLADFTWGGFSHLLQFCLVGSTGLVIDLAVFASLLHLGVSFKLARGLAIWVAMTSNFAFNRRLTFSYSRGGSILIQYPRFVATCALGAVVSWSVAVGLVQSVALFTHRVYLAAIMGVVAGTICNFLISRHWVFRHKPTPSS
jgi:dolichol-phosphate mannosyltransferase